MAGRRLTAQVDLDTELAGRLAGFDRVNLAAMVQRLLGLQLMKGHGAADWSRRPLPEDWLVYAALDVEVLIELRDAVDAALVEAGKDEWARQEFEWVRTRPEPAGVDQGTGRTGTGRVGVPGDDGDRHVLAGNEPLALDGVEHRPG